jgi:hypothetical protein
MTSSGQKEIKNLINKHNKEVENKKLFTEHKRFMNMVKGLRRDSDLTEIDDLFKCYIDGYNTALDDLLYFLKKEIK